MEVTWQLLTEHIRTVSSPCYSVANIDLTVNMIYTDSERRDIIGQYLAFCEIVRKMHTIHKDLKTAIREAIRVCIECGNLTDYLTLHGPEVEDMMFTLLNQEEVTECYGDYREEQGRSQGLEQGLNLGLEQGLSATMSALKEFYPDFESLYNAKIANNETYSQFSKEEVQQIYLSL